MLQLWNDLGSILKAPFVGNLDLVHLFLLVGLVLLFAVAWAIIVRDLGEIASEV